VAVGGVWVGTAATGVMVGDAPSDPSKATNLTNGEVEAAMHSSEVVDSFDASPVQSSDVCIVEESV
jgi:hypothetical protein